MKIENYEKLKLVADNLKTLKLDLFTIDTYEHEEYFEITIKFPKKTK